MKTGPFQDRRARCLSLDRILQEEEPAVIECDLKHPQEGYRRLAWLMVDEDVAYLRASSVYLIFERSDLLYRWKSASAATRQPKPKAPDERWHTDIFYLWVISKWYFLVTVLDGFSR